MAYQCAKMSSTEEREKLRKWILDLEYDYFKVPQPDLSIFLDVPFAFTERKLLQEVRTGDDRDYLNGQKDIHESSLDLQRMVREVYLSAAEYDENLHVVDCSTEDQTMAAPEIISAKIKDIITQYMK